MIFDREFDESLWLIVKNDRKNRMKVLEFIKSIPYEFILKIQNVLIEYNVYKLENEGVPFSDRKYRCFNGGLYVSNGDLYSFNVDIQNDSLFISRSTRRYARQFSDFSILLSSYKEDVNNYETQEIGKIFYDFHDKVSSPNDISFEMGDSIVYSSVKVPFGNLLFSNTNNGIIKFCGLDRDSIPADYNLECVENKLVRRRSFGKEKNDI